MAWTLPDCAPPVFGIKAKQRPANGQPRGNCAPPVREAAGRSQTAATIKTTSFGVTKLKVLNFIKQVY